MNWGERPHRGRALVALAGVCLSPLLAMAIYLVAAPWVFPSRWWDTGLVAFVLLGVATGLACVARLPEPVAVRVVLAVLYVPASFSALMILSLLADGLIYGNW